MYSTRFGPRVRRVYMNDSAARRFVHEHCPYAAAAYDCLRPPSYKADLWRYCVLYTRGGIYLDVEDHLLVDFASLHRPCDSLLLARDLCPEKDDRLARQPCKMPAVQISIMAAAPRHPFLRCALALAVRNIQYGVHGRNTLDLTGPVLAGACLRKLHGSINYTMGLFMAHELTKRTRWNPKPVAVYDAEHRPVVRAHAWPKDERRSISQQIKHKGKGAYVNYVTAWAEHGAFTSPNCTARQQRMVDVELRVQQPPPAAAAAAAAHAGSNRSVIINRTRKMSSKEAFLKLWRAIDPDNPDEALAH